MAVPLQALHHPQRVLVVAEVPPEALFQAHVERLLADVAEGGMAEVVPQAERLDEVLVQPQRPGHRARDARDLQRVGETGPVVVTLGATNTWVLCVRRRKALPWRIRSRTRWKGVRSESPPWGAPARPGRSAPPAAESAPAPGPRSGRELRRHRPAVAPAQRCRFQSLTPAPVSLCTIWLHFVCSPGSSVNTGEPCSGGGNSRAATASSRRSTPARAARPPRTPPRSAGLGVVVDQQAVEDVLLGSAEDAPHGPTRCPSLEYTGTPSWSTS